MQNVLSAFTLQKTFDLLGQCRLVSEPKALKLLTEQLTGIVRGLEHIEIWACFLDGKTKHIINMDSPPVQSNTHGQQPLLHVCPTSYYPDSCIATAELSITNNYSKTCQKGEGNVRSTCLSITFRYLEPSEVAVLRLVLPYLHDAAMRASHAKEHTQTAFKLTKREREVLHWIALGKTNWETAQILKLSERTVKFHASNLFKKLGITRRSQAAAMASLILPPKPSRPSRSGSPAPSMPVRPQ